LQCSIWAPCSTVIRVDDVDPELLKMYDKLGVPLRERELLAGVAVDAALMAQSDK
jgi:hypothetical protein